MCPMEQAGSCSRPRHLQRLLILQPDMVGQELALLQPAVKSKAPSRCLSELDVPLLLLVVNARLAF